MSDPVLPGIFDARIEHLTPQTARFDGSDYAPDQDNARLTGQIQRVYALMGDAHWRTVSEIAERTGDPETSVSAQLRHLRKPRFGAHDVQKRRRAGSNLWEYRIARTA